MPLHLLKLAVGIDDVEHLQKRQRALRAKDGTLRHRTRMTPRRQSELMDGGSMYWVIRGSILVRQPLLALKEDKDEKGRSLCIIELEDRHILVRPTAKRPFQGWRYLPDSSAPPDLNLAKGGSVDPDMPKDMRQELSRLGLI